MPHYDNDNMNKLIDECLKKDLKTDVCRTWVKAMEGICAVDKKTINRYMDHYKNLGIVKIEDFNNEMVERNGRKFYSLVGQSVIEEHNSTCPMSLLGYGFMVDALQVFWFDKEKDRDMAFKRFKGE